MQLNRLARDTVEKLLAETGHALSVSDFGHIHTLHVLAERVSHPYKAADIDLVEMPRAVGGVLLHPLSLGAWQWLEAFAIPALGNHWLADVAIAYAMAHSHTPDVLRDGCTPKELRKALRKWLRGLSCTIAALSRVVDAVAGASEQLEEGARARAEYGPIIALLCREYGGTPQGWAWGVSAETVRGFLDEHRAKVEAENAVAAKASAGAGASVSTTPQSKIDAMRSFRRYAKALRESWQKT